MVNIATGGFDSAFPPYLAHLQWALRKSFQILRSRDEGYFVIRGTYRHCKVAVV